MLKLRLVANNDTAGELVLEEKHWRPARSLMAIANQKFAEKKGDPVVMFGELKDIDENIGHGLDDAACYILSREMKEVAEDPFGLVDYGMTVDIEDGEMVYTYPTDMCYAHFEDSKTGKYYTSLESNDIVGKQVRSWFRTPKAKMDEIIDFMSACGGFSMP